MQICRVCMSSAPTLMDIFTDRPLADCEFSLAEMLNELVDFKVKRGDRLPQTICVACGLNVQIAFRFRRRFHHSHHLLCMKVMENETKYVQVLETDSSDESEVSFENNSSAKSRNISSSSSSNGSNNGSNERNSSNSSRSSASTENEDYVMLDIKTEVQEERSASEDVQQDLSQSMHSAETLPYHRYPLRPIRRKNYYQPAVTPSQNLVPPRTTATRSRTRQFKCDHCRSTFATTKNLLKHQLRHSGGPKTLSKTSMVQIHSNTHGGPLWNICTLCMRSTTHSGDRPHICH